MPEIKTREVAKGTVKAIDKSAMAAERMKSAYIRTKDKADHSLYSAEVRPMNTPPTVFQTGRRLLPVKPSTSLTSSGEKV